MREAGYWRTLGHLVPEAMVDPDKAREIRDQLRLDNERLIQEMRDDSIHFLSPRGDQIDFSDPILADLGFKGITFEMDPRNRRDTIVSLNVGNFTYQAVLDEYFALRETGPEGRSVVLPDDGELLRNILLSHLHAIRCTDTVKDTEAALPGESGERSFRGRRAHRRILAEGYSPTRAQILLILRDYDIDLNRWNEERARQGKERRVTYVKESEADTNQGAPVRSVAPQATNKLRAILTAT